MRSLQLTWLSRKDKQSASAWGQRQERYRQYIEQVYLSCVLIILTITFGIVGFMVVEDYNFNEAFYMTIITLSTVGYTEVKPLTENGRLFAILLILTNIGIFAYAISVLSNFVVQGEFKRMVNDRSIQNKIDQLNEHIIVCGLGRYGEEVIDNFLQQRISFVVIEKDQESIDNCSHRKNLLYLVGDATSDEILEAAGIYRSQGLITTLPDDADNAYIVLTARMMQPKIRIVSRAERGKSERTLKLAGANEVITPERVGGFYMATLVGQPDVVEFFEVMTNQTGAKISFEELACEVLPSELQHASIRELDIRSKTGANLIGIRLPNGKYVVNPNPDTVLKPHMRLIVLGNEEQIAQFKTFWLSYAQKMNK